ncbi:MAG: ATP-grasp domain-containing protein [Pseudomonadota bacterium]
MSTHAIFAAPFFMDATLKFVSAAAQTPGVNLTLVSQDPLEKVPAEVRHLLAGHAQVRDGLDPQQLVDAARHLQQRHGPARAYIASLEQLQVPLAAAREVLGIPGLSVEAAHNFRDKSQMKNVLRAHGVPCARHALVGDIGAAKAFAAKVGYPIIVKPPAGAGGKGTFRLDNDGQLNSFLSMYPPVPSQASLYEEFVSGTEYSFDSVCVNGEMRWHSISRYFPSPLNVMKNPWIQWVVVLPRDIAGPEFDPIRTAAAQGVRALGLETGLSHMEWFHMADGRIAVSEVGARPPGAQFTSLLSYAHDVNFYRVWARLMILGEFEPPERRYAAGAAYFRGQGVGRVRKIHGLDEAQRRFGDLVMETHLPREGQVPSSSYEGDGYVIVRHPDTARVEEALSEIVKLVRVELA